MTIVTSPDSRCLSVCCSRLDAAAGRELLRTAEDAFRCGIPAVVVDFSQVQTIDSHGVAALVTLRRRLPAPARIALAGLNARVLVTAAATCLHELFDIYPRTETALAALRA